MAKAFHKTVRRILKAIFNPASALPHRPEDDLYLIARAGKVAGINMIVDALEKHSELFERNGDTIEAGRLISNMFWSGDLQATLRDITALAPGEAPSLAVFSVSCPQNGLYRNHVGNFHAFFKALGFNDFKDHLNPARPPEGDCWYAQNGSGMFSPGFLNKEVGSFSIAVPLGGLLKALKIDPQDYAETVRRAQAGKAAEKGIKLCPEKGNKPHRPSF